MKHQASLARRQFLKQMATGVAATAAIAAVAPTAAAQGTPAAQTASRYQKDSAHIRNYYNTVRGL